MDALEKVTVCQSAVTSGVTLVYFTEVPFSCCPVALYNGSAFMVFFRLVLFLVCLVFTLHFYSAVWEVLMKKLET